MKKRGIVVHFPAGVSGLSLLQCVHTICGTHPTSYEWVQGDLYPEIKRPGREIGHSFRLVQRLRISGAVPTLPPICLQGRRRNKLTLVSYSCLDRATLSRYCLKLFQQCALYNDFRLFLQNQTTLQRDSVASTSITSEISIYKLIRQTPFTTAAF